MAKQGLKVRAVDALFTAIGRSWNRICILSTAAEIQTQLPNFEYDGVTVRNAPFWTLHPAGCAEPIMIIIHNRDDDTKSGRISNVRFFNITCDSETGIFLSGSPDNHIEDVLSEHVRIVVRAKSKWPKGRYDLRPGIRQKIEEIKSFGFHMRRADRVTVRNCSVEFKGDERECFAHEFFDEAKNDHECGSIRDRFLYDRKLRILSYKSLQRIALRRKGKYR